MFRFANISILYLLAAVPVMTALYIAARYARRRRLSRFGERQTVKELSPAAAAWRSNLKFVLFTTAVALMVVAAARPQLGSKFREKEVEGVEIMLAVDVSNSMLAEDLEPNRLERTKYAIARLLEGMDKNRVGLIVFAGEAKVQLPITSDYLMAQSFARRISPSLVSVQGTSVAQALNLAQLSFSDQSDHARVVVLITDGESHDDDAVAAAKAAAERGIKIFTVGIGTPEGAPIEIGGEYIRDAEGNMVVSKLNEKMLQDIALATDAAYVRATKQSIGLDEIVRKIDDMEQGKLTALQFEEFDEQYPYILAIALLVLVLEFFIMERRNPLLARFNIFE